MAILLCTASLCNEAQLKASSPESSHAVLYRELALCTPKEKFAGTASPNVAESGPDVSLANGPALGEDQFHRICKKANPPYRNPIPAQTYARLDRPVMSVRLHGLLYVYKPLHRHADV